MYIRKYLIGSMLVAGIIVFLPSCSKDENDLSKTDIALAQDDTYVEAMFDEIDDLVLSETKALDDNDYSTNTAKSTEEACYTVTLDHPDSVTFPKEITIDFGEGCSVVFNGDTITRSGQIIINITNRWFMPGAMHIMTFNNFIFNGVKVEGTRTMTNDGWNERQNLEISVSLENGKITFEDSTFITRNASHVREWARHLNPLNDTIYITGTASGKNMLGENYTRTITEPLALVRCSEVPYRWGIADGKIEVVNSARGTITIEYGGNGCTSDLIIEKDGKRYNYQFRYRYRNNLQQ
jgi:hypothetical protein